MVKKKPVKPTGTVHSRSRTNGSGVRAATETFRALSPVQQIDAVRNLSGAILDRLSYMRQAGITFNGDRDMYAVLGYLRILDTADFRDRYERGGIAGSVIDVFPDATWRGVPAFKIIEDKDPTKETELEAAWTKLEKKHGIIAKFRRVDKLSLLSTFAVLLIGAPGDLSTPLPKGSTDSLLYLQPYIGGGSPNRDLRLGSRLLTSIEADCQVRDYETNPSSRRFGEPNTYQLRRTDFYDPAFLRPVHYSRIIHVADGCLDNEVFGQPGMERVWNLLDDLEKVTGGGSEAFWLRANAGMHIDIDKDMSLPSAEDQITALKAQVDDYRHQLTRVLRTRGVAIEQLGSDVANFSQSADSILTQIAGAKRIPKRILTGSEMGELASSQDRDNWKDQVLGRQQLYAGPYMVRRLIDRLIEYGYLPAPKIAPDAYDVVWPHIQTLTEQEKADGAKLWGETATAEGQVFTNDEIRDKWYAMEPLPATIKAELKPVAPVAVAPASPTDQPRTPESADKKFPRAAGGPGSGPHPSDPSGEHAHGTVVASSKLGQVEVVRGHSAPGKFDHQGSTRYQARRKNGENVGTRSTVREAKELLRQPKESERQNFPSGHLFPDVKWKELEENRAGQNGSHEYGTTQIELPNSIANVLLAFGEMIPESELYAPLGGRETDPHVTVCYGLPPNLDPSKVQAVASRQGWSNGVVTFGRIRVFSNPDYDVIVAEVKSQDLENIHLAIRTQLDATVTRPTYIPHATVAYVKPGEGTKYVDDKALDGMTFKFDSIVMVSVDGARTEIRLA